ncbi:hypothetical protein MRX96_008361 [Rhipicephalus microplus]
MYCAYRRGTNSCHGDSGGPLMSRPFGDRYVQVGIVSFAVGCARKPVMIRASLPCRNHQLIPRIEGIYGAVDTTSKYATRTPIAAVALHPRFSEEEYHDDIAVLKVPQAFNFGPYVKPVCLDFDLGDLTGKTVTVAGWGPPSKFNELLFELNGVCSTSTCAWSSYSHSLSLRHATGLGPSDKLRYTKLQVLQQSECEQKLQSYKFNKSSMMCAYGEDTDACQGDSGSAVMACQGIYVPVSVYKEWILKTIADGSAFKPIIGQNMV